MNQSVRKNWHDKLESLEAKLAAATNAQQQLAIQRQIIEAKDAIIALGNTEHRDGHECNQTIVFLDLCHFSQIIRSLEIGQRIGPMATQVVQNQIEELIRFAVKQSGCTWDKCFIKGTGDGAVLCFPSALAADRFAEALLVHADEDYNRQASHDLEHRCFRVGIYTGNVIRTARDIAGAAVAFAARLEAAAATGEVLMDAGSWATLPPEVKERYGPEEQVSGKQHDRPFSARRRRVGIPAPWDAAKSAEESTANDDATGSGLNTLEAILEGLTRVRRSSGVAEPPGNLGLALSEGKERVGKLMKSLAGEALNGLTLDHVEAVISEAIGHGAGIYNHSARGRTGCGEIYFLAASGLLKLGVHNSTVRDSIPFDASLALSWLQAIVESVGKVTIENGDDVAWELRYCFDAIPFIPRCDELTMLLRDIARRNDVSPIPQIVRQVVEKSRGLPPHVSAYELRHTVRTLLWLYDHHQLDDRKFRHAAAALRTVNESSGRIIMRNAQDLQRELAITLISFCQNIEAGGSHGGGLFGWLSRR